MSHEMEELGVYGRLYSGIAPAKILDFFIEYQDIYSQSDIARHTSLSNKTAFTAIKKLEKLRLIKLDGKIGQAKMYKLNLEESKAARLLTDASLEIAMVENEGFYKVCVGQTNK